MNLKPINQQVVVLMDASSGIGREAASQFARREVKVVVSARSESGLLTLITRAGAKAEKLQLLRPT